MRLVAQTNFPLARGPFKLTIQVCFRRGLLQRKESFNNQEIFIEFFYGKDSVQRQRALTLTYFLFILSICLQLALSSKPTIFVICFICLYVYEHVCAVMS